MSKTREVLLSFLETAEHPLSVPEILEQFSEYGMEVNKTTVYRELEKLLAFSVVKPIYFGDDKVRYEMTTREHHHHVVCVQCKKVDDVVLSFVNLQEKKIADRLNFKILDHSLEFFGICQKCQ